MKTILETALEAAKQAGAILMAHWQKVEKREIRKKSATDFLSFVDEASEKKIIEIIHNTFPEHSILAEESGANRKKTDYRWIIDPLDGTKNYLNGIPVFAVSIAVEYKNEVIIGVIYDPVHKEMFWAEKEKGAFLNGKPISVSQNKKLGESLIATGFPFKTKHLLNTYLTVFKNIFTQSIGARRLGAAAMDLAYIACGRFDGFWEVGLKPWDVAAGALIIREAGGKVTDFWEQDHFIHNSYIIATNSHIHLQLSTIIREQFPFYISILEGTE